MTNELKNIIDNLRKLNDREKYLWLLNEYPLENKNYFLVFKIIPHFSWGKKERTLLMEYYLSNLPFSSELPYLAFLKVSPLSEYLIILDRIIKNKDGEDLSLFFYYIGRIFEYEVSEVEYEKNKIAIDEILKNNKSLSKKL